MAKPHPNLLLVEGKDEQYTIPFLMDEHIVWGDKKSPAVLIDQADGIENLLKAGFIEAELKRSGLKAVGILVDADDTLESRWAAVRERCRRVAKAFPDDLPAGGLVHVTATDLRIGVWIMPDNRSRGMLETFLGFLLTPERIPLWELAKESCDRAIPIEHCHKPAHRDKAWIHTYLALVEPPGESLGHSVREHLLDPRLSVADDFVRWFIELYQLTRRSRLADTR